MRPPAASDDSAGVRTSEPVWVNGTSFSPRSSATTSTRWGRMAARRPTSVSPRVCAPRRSCRRCVLV
eukprot:3566473-Prymnesium_polylepis.7